MEEQSQQINVLKKNLEEADELIQFGEADYAQMRRVIEDQQKMIATLQNRYKSIESEYQKAQAKSKMLISPGTLESVIHLIKKNMAGVSQDAIRSSGWDARLQELTDALLKTKKPKRYSETRESTKQKMDQLEEELDAFQCK